MNPSLKIGELAKRTETLVQTVRYYEQQGLLKEPARSQGNYRLYSETHVERVQFIRHCRSLDMTLEEIRTLLRFVDAPEENCGQVNALLDEHIEHVASRIRELRLLEKNLRRLRSHCHSTEAAKHCGILQSLSTTPKERLQRSTVEHRNGRLLKTHK